MDHSITLTHDPAWPKFLADSGLLLLVLLALVLIGLTVWTYVGVQGATVRRVLGLIGLRLAALLAACLALVRPSLAVRDELHVPSTLLIVVDASKSMATRDAGPGGGRSRWEYLLSNLRDCEPTLQRLRERENVKVVFARFAADVAEFNPQEPGEADGPRTDFGGMLAKLYGKYSNEGPIRGLIVLSDGGDNGASEAPLPWAAKWHNLPSRVHTIGYGRADTRSDQKDINVVGIAADPSEVPAKNELTVKGTIDAPGFEGSKVRIQLFVDDGREAVDTLDTELLQTKGNQVLLKCLAPEKPGKDGQMKVTLRVQPLPGEVSVDNNEASTFVRVLKEGISVLLVDRADSCWESQMFCRNALRLDKNIRLTTREFRDDRALGGVPDFFNFDHEHYDVIIIGDVRAAQLKERDPNALTRIAKAVEQGTGLLMFAGEFSLGDKSDWRDDPVARLLPVEFNVAERDRDVPGLVKLMPRAEGWDRYVMRLTDREHNAEAWQAMRELNGITRLGSLKGGAFVLADASVDRKTLEGQTVKRLEPVLVGLDGTGRRLVLGTDTTWRWVSNEQGKENHRRFWQQAVLWLAHREDAQGGIWIEPERRRLAAGEKFVFATGLRDKHGEKMKGGTFSVKVTAANKVKAAPDLVPQDRGQRGTFWNTDEAGDYELEVTGEGKDEAGEPIKATATARFHVYADSAEAAPQPARPDFLKDLKDAGGGEYHEAKDLAHFLQDLEKQPLPQSRPKTALWPDWRNNRLSGFLVGFFLVFVALLSAEWFLRRRWGFV